MKRWIKVVPQLSGPLAQALKRGMICRSAAKKEVKKLVGQR
jgi:hypothetical protein